MSAPRVFCSHSFGEPRRREGGGLGRVVFLVQASAQTLNLAHSPDNVKHETQSRKVSPVYLAAKIMVGALGTTQS